LKSCKLSKQRKFKLRNKRKEKFEKLWDNAQDKAVWKGLINTTWATKANQGKLQPVGVARCELFPNGHPSVID
jgi:hypothetical protein